MAPAGAADKVLLADGTTAEAGAAGDSSNTAETEAAACSEEVVTETSHLR